MGANSNTDDEHSLCRAIDRAALCTIRDIIERDEPIANPSLDDYLDATVLEVRLNDGLCNADAARIDVQWTTQADYKFHYSDTEGVNFRWR